MWGEVKLLVDHLDAEGSGLCRSAKGNRFTQPVDIEALAASAKGIEQATELYLISRVAIDIDHPAERAYLQALGHKLNLPADLIAHLDHQLDTTE